MKVEVIPYLKEHAYMILTSNIREHDAQDLTEFDKYAEIWGSEGPAYTVLINDAIVFCGGVVDIGWNRGEAWTLMSELFYKYPKTCFKTCKNELNRIIKDKGFKRVQATIDPNLSGGIRFAEHLGFKNEGLMKKFGPTNQDMCMMGRIQ